MNAPLQIVLHDLVSLPSVEPTIRRRARRLERWSPGIAGCRVAVEAEGNRHRTGHVYRVRIHLLVPGDEIAIGTQAPDEDIHRAIRGAFDAAGRELGASARRQQWRVKARHAATGGGIEPPQWR